MNLYSIFPYQLNAGIVIGLRSRSLDFDCELSLVGRTCYLSFLLQVQDKSQPIYFKFPGLLCMLVVYLQYR